MHLNSLMLMVFTVSIAAVSHAKTPRFQDYPVPLEVKKNTQNRLSVPSEGRRYQTLLNELSARRANYGGHYVLDHFSCGGGCQSIAIYNKKTAKGFLHPEDFRDCYSPSKGSVSRDFAFKANSRLLILTGNRTGEPSRCEKVYYVVQGNQFKQIAQQWIYPK